MEATGHEEDNKTKSSGGLVEPPLMRGTSDASILTEDEGFTPGPFSDSTRSVQNYSSPFSSGKEKKFDVEPEEVEKRMEHYHNQIQREMESIDQARRASLVATGFSSDGGALLEEVSLDVGGALRPPVEVAVEPPGEENAAAAAAAAAAGRSRLHHVGEALDVVVVRDREGTLRSTAFHVNFNHMKLSMKQGYKRALKGLGDSAKGLFKDFGKKTKARSLSFQQHQQEDLSNSSNLEGDFLLQFDGYPVKIFVNDNLRPVQMYLDKHALLYFEKDTSGKFVRTPTSEQLAVLGLMDGKNNLRFELTFNDQKGMRLIHAETSCFVWDVDCRIVLCDIDGTITKTDVGGFVGTSTNPEDTNFVHDGICPFLSDLVEDGINIMFVTSRPMMLKQLTKTFLSTICQDGCFIPEGPLFNCPQNLLNVVFQEVVTKTIHRYKTGVLQAVMRLFELSGRENPEDLFRLGFGNKPTDAKAYEQVCVRSQFIFIIGKDSRIVVWGTKVNEEDGMVPLIFSTYADPDLLAYARTALRPEGRHPPLLPPAAPAAAPAAAAAGGGEGTGKKGDDCLVS